MARVPTWPVEFVVPRWRRPDGTVHPVAVTKYSLMKQPLVRANRGAGAGGFLQVQNAKGNPHEIIIPLATPLAEAALESLVRLTGAG